jgi:hypothetical protein
MSTLRIFIDRGGGWGRQRDILLGGGGVQVIAKFRRQMLVVCTFTVPS